MMLFFMTKQRQTRDLLLCGLPSQKHLPDTLPDASLVAALPIVRVHVLFLLTPRRFSWVSTLRGRTTPVGPALRGGG